MFVCYAVYGNGQVYLGLLVYAVSCYLFIVVVTTTTITTFLADWGAG